MESSGSTVHLNMLEHPKLTINYSKKISCIPESPLFNFLFRFFEGSGRANEQNRTRFFQSRFQQGTVSDRSIFNS